MESIDVTPGKSCSNVVRNCVIYDNNNNNDDRKLISFVIKKLIN